MQAGQTTAAQKQTRPKGSLGEFLADGALLALLLVATFRLVVPAFHGWYHEDDMHNVRWVLEYRYEPWLALLDRHALHDHIRPLTLMTLWLGTWLSDGEYWGQHLLLVLLNVAAAAGVLALGRALGGSWRAGLLAGLLAVSGWGWVRLLDWNALINSAGETAFGIWGLVAALRGLKRPGWLVPAMLAMLASALYKEPGSVIYPLTALTMGWSAWRAGERGRHLLAFPAMVLIGIGTFAWTWHSANISRMGTQSESLFARAFEFLQVHAGMLLNIWPGVGRVTEPFGAGVPIFALALVLLADLLGAGLLERLAGRLGWLLGAGLCWAICTLGDVAESVVLVPLVLLVLARRWSEPPPGLVMYLLSVGVMAPFQATEVQIIAAAHGLALYTGVGLDRLIRAAGGWRPGRVVAIGAAALAAGLLLGRTLTPPNPKTYDMQREQMKKTYGFGAVARTLGVSQVQAVGMSITDQEILPLVGIVAQRDSRGVIPTVLVSGGLLLNPARGMMEQVIFPNDLVQGVPLPIIPGGLESLRANESPQGASFDVAPGYYALGVGTAAGKTMKLTLMARDACGRAWTASQEPTLPVPFTLTAMVIDPGCSPLKVAWIGDAEEPDGIAMLAPLLPPVVSMWHPTEIPRMLRVDPSGRPPQ